MQGAAADAASKARAIVAFRCAEPLHRLCELAFLRGSEAGALDTEGGGRRAFCTASRGQFLRRGRIKCPCRFGERSGCRAGGRERRHGARAHVSAVGEKWRTTTPGGRAPQGMYRKSAGERRRCVSLQSAEPRLHPAGRQEVL